MKPRVALHWFRRDLRLEDNHGLYRALSEHEQVLPLFIFDTTILDKLEDKHDRRVDFIHHTLTDLHQRLVEVGSGLHVEHGRPLDVWKRLLGTFDVTAVVVNHDHEPYGIARDNEITALVKAHGIPFRSFKDISIFERSEITKDDGLPYTVYTPYMRKWRDRFLPGSAAAFPSEKHLQALWKHPPRDVPSLVDIGFNKTDLVLPDTLLTDDLLRNYPLTRDLPGVEGTSNMSTHLRFGTVSVRDLVRRSVEL
ncbi:MAG: deoxyribodipyrimidine photo-lyase, partial [Flavobacteriales bacterium]